MKYVRTRDGFELIVSAEPRIVITEDPSEVADGTAAAYVLLGAMMGVHIIVTDYPGGPEVDPGAPAVDDWYLATRGWVRANAGTGDGGGTVDLTGYARTDDLPAPSDATPTTLGVAAAGTSEDYARDDHRHKLPTLGELGALPSTYSPAIADVSGLTGALADKAPKASPTFTGTVSGVTKGHVGLGDADNTSDADKPISDATAEALAVKVSSTTVTAFEVVPAVPAFDPAKAGTMYAVPTNGA